MSLALPSRKADGIGDAGECPNISHAYEDVFWG